MELTGAYKFAIAAIDGVHEKFFPIVEDISGVVGGIISIATLLYLGSKIWSSYAKNEPIDVYPLLRPFVIAFLCANFSTMVCRPIDALIEPISSFLYEKKTTELVTRETVKNALSHDAVQPEKAKGSGGIMNWLNNAWDSLMEHLFELIGLCMDIIIGFLQFILSFILMCSRVFFLSILCIMGPIAFAVSLFPGYQQTLTQWIAKYVSISFWLPCIYMCDIFINVLGSSMIEMASNLLTGGFTGAAVGAVAVGAGTAAVGLSGGTAVGAGAAMTGILVLTISILLGALSYFLYTTVPTVSSWIITGGDVHGIQGMLGATTIVSALTSFGGAKMGSKLAQSNGGKGIGGAISGLFGGGSKGGGQQLGGSGGGIGSAVSGLFGKK